MNHPNATIKDIAKTMGVSPSTVSRVLNGKYHRKTQKVTRILEMAEEMNYKPNVTALGLRMNKSFLVGVIIPRINNEFYSDILSGMQETLESSNYKAIICQSDDDPEKELEQIKSLLSVNVDGIIISPSKHSMSDRVTTSIENAGKKLLLIDRTWPDAQSSFVKVDDIRGGLEVTQHLIAQGNKHITYLGFNATLTNDSDRKKGYLKALSEAGLQSGGVFYFDEIKDERDFFSRFFKNGGKVDAIFCYNDEIALFTLNEVKKAGKKVPGDIAIAGFDNRRMCEFTSPSLTSTEHFSMDIGKISASNLINLIEGGKDLQEMVVPKLVVRESSALKRSGF